MLSSLVCWFADDTMETDMFNSGTEEQETEEEYEYEEELTAAEVLHKLEEAWINEKQAPELLGKYHVICHTAPHRPKQLVMLRVKNGDS